MRSVVALVESPGGAPVDRLQESTAWLATRWWATLEGLHYKEEIWKAMSKELREKVVELRKAKSACCAVKATTTTTDGPVPMDVSDQLQTLTCVGGELRYFLHAIYLKV